MKGDAEASAEVVTQTVEAEQVSFESRFAGTNLRRFQTVVLQILVGLASLVIVAIVFWVSGYSVTDIAVGVYEGAISAPGSFATTVRWALAYSIVGAGVVVAIRAGFFNVGAQGQIYVAACVAVTVPLLWPDGPAILVVVVAVVLSAIAGALWALGPGILRVKYGTNEVITTLMMNFLGILVLRAVTSGVLRDDEGSAEASVSKQISDAVRISDETGVSFWTIALGVLVLIGTWFLLHRTRFGLLSALAGRNPLMASWQGINVSAIGITSFAISGALAGLVGAMEVLGADGRLYSGFAPGLGFTAILVAIASGFRMGGLIFFALFFGGLQASLLYLPVVTDVPSSSLDIFRGLVALLITVSPVAVFAVLRGRRNKEANR